MHTWQVLGIITVITECLYHLLREGGLFVFITLGPESLLVNN